MTMALMLLQLSLVREIANNRQCLSLLQAGSSMAQIQMVVMVVVRVVLHGGGGGGADADPD